jgi:hypothetical protein
MKDSSIKLLFLSAIAALVFISCKHQLKDELVGNWQLARVKLVNSEQQQKMMQGRIASLHDSISKYTDTAKLNTFQKQLNMMEKSSAEMQSKQDSAIKKTRWEFKDNGNFVANQGGQKNEGLWSFDQEKMLLFTIVGKQTYSQHVSIDGDSLTLELDSLNYLKFARVK